MSYESAPATGMLATYCACCGRPLVDAASVEIGMGPICRAEHGWEEMDDAVRQQMNKLVWAAAVFAEKGKIERVRRCAAAIEAAGFVGLASKIRERFRNAERLAVVTVSREDQWLLVETPFRRGEAEEFKAAWRAIPGRRWDGEARVNRLPVSQRAALWALLQRFFPGKYGVNDDGQPFRVPGGEAA